MLLLSLLLQNANTTLTSEPTGLEWLVFASFFVPAILLAVIFYLGRKSAV